MPNVLITGANRGLGLEFARQYRADGWDVIATARHSSPELDALGVRIEMLEMSDLDAVGRIQERIDEPLDLLIANAGIIQPSKVETPNDARAWAAMLVVNTVAPYVLAHSLMFRVGEAKGKLIAISSGMGSIADSSGGHVPYRTSKAALNMAWHALAIEARPLGVAVATLNPGWVQTRMGGASAPLTPEQSIGQLRQVIAALDLDRSGSFLDRDGTTYPW